MAASIYHAYTQTVPDGAATSVVRPSDWNSAHLISGLPDGISFGGNTAGAMAVISSGTVVFAGGNNVTLSQQGNTVTISGPNAAGAQTGISGIAGGGATASSGTVLFSNSNGVSFGVAGQTVTASVATNYQSQGDYLTTAMQSNAATISNLNLSAGAASQNLSNVVFSNSNGVSFGLNGSTVTATVATNYQSTGAYLTTAGLSQDSSKYAGTNAAITGGSVTVNTSGVSINLPAYLTTAQPPGAYLTTAARSQDSSKYAGTNGAITGGSITVDTSGVSVNLPAYLTTAMQSNAATISNINVSAGATSNNLSAVTFNNSNGVSFGLTGSVVTATVKTDYQTSGAYLTTAALSQDSSKYAGINGAITGGSITVNTSGVSVNLPAYLTTAMQSNAATISNIRVSAGTLSNNLSAITFSDSNGVSFGLNGSVITATVQTNYITTAMASNRGTDFVQATAAFAGTNASGTINSTGISVSVAAGGGATLSVFEPFGNNVNATSLGHKSLYFVPFVLPQAGSFCRLGELVLVGPANSTRYSFTTALAAGVTRSSQIACGITGSYGLWTQGTGTNSTRIESLFSSTSRFGYTAGYTVQDGALTQTVINGVSFEVVTNIGTNGAYTMTTIGSSSTVTGAATTSIGNTLSGGLGANLVNYMGFPTSLSAGNYWLGMVHSSSSGSTGTNVTAASFSKYINAGLGVPFQQLGNTATANSNMPLGCGVYSATTAGIPQNVGFSEINNFNNSRLYFVLENQSL